MTTSDRGANEVLARKYFATLVKDCDNVFYLEANCLEHQAHLITLSGLTFTDQALSKLKPWKYYTSLAIATNVLRTVAKEVYLQWCLMFGPMDANKQVKKLFPKCQSGRWGSIHLTEERFLTATFERLSLVLKALAEKWGSNKKPTKKVSNSNKENVPPATATDLNPDTLSLEQAAEYSKRMGKWRAYLLTTSQDKLWGRIVEVVHWSRSPLVHFTNFLKGKLSDVELLSSGNHLCQLANGKAASILDEFSNLLMDSDCNLESIEKSNV